MGTTAGVSKDTLISSFTFFLSFSFFKFIIVKGKCDRASMSRKGKREDRSVKKDSDRIWKKIC